MPWVILCMRKSSATFIMPFIVPYSCHLLLYSDQVINGKYYSIILQLYVTNTCLDILLTRVLVFILALEFYTSACLLSSTKYTYNISIYYYSLHCMLAYFGFAPPPCILLTPSCHVTFSLLILAMTIIHKE